MGYALLSAPLPLVVGARARPVVVRRTPPSHQRLELFAPWTIRVSALRHRRDSAETPQVAAFRQFAREAYEYPSKTMPLDESRARDASVEARVAPAFDPALYTQPSLRDQGGRDPRGREDDSRRSPPRFI